MFLLVQLTIRQHCLRELLGGKLATRYYQNIEVMAWYRTRDNSVPDDLIYSRCVVTTMVVCTIPTIYLRLIFM